jgi:hypothetical protein
LIAQGKQVAPGLPAGMPLWLDIMAAFVGPLLVDRTLGLVCGAFFLAYLYLVSGRSILVLSLWHMTYNMMVAPPTGAGISAAVVSTIIMAWGGVIAWLWWRGSRTKQKRNTD